MQAGSLQRVDAIEGVRGVLSVIVVAGHVNASLVLWFWGCMEIFFAISGYLIGSIALRYQGCPDFWPTYLARRTLRIWPLYFVVFGFCVVVDLIQAYWAGTSGSPIGAGAVRDLFFLQNTELYAERYPDPPLVGHGYPTMFHHSWSVAMEEQFYLLAPFLAWAIAAGLRRCALSARKLALCIALVLAGCIMIRVAGVSWWLLLGRLDAFLLGTIVACLSNSRGPARLEDKVATTRAAFVVMSAIAAGFMLAYYVPQRYEYRLRSAYEWRHYLGVAIFALFGATLIAACITRSFPRLLAPLEWPAVQYLGKVSYSMYLWHVPLLILFKRCDWYVNGVPRGFHLPVFLAIMVLVSHVSYQLIERPFIERKPRFARGAPRHDDQTVKLA